MMSRRHLVLVALTGLSSIVACSSSSSTPDPTAACANIDVSRFKELIIVDDRVVTDPRASNANDGAWSFRHAIEELAGPGADTSQFLLDWAKQYSSLGSVNGYAVAARPTTNKSLVCPWLRLTPANGCDDTCSVCADHKLDLALAPFRLMGIVNRLDEHTKRGGAGEGRLAYALTSGPGDLASSVPVDMSVIIEFNLPVDANRNEGYWAKRWHALGTLGDFDADFNNHLADLVGEFEHRENLAQVRTNERVLDWDWNLRQFTLTGGALTLAATQDTPDPSLNATTRLADFLKQNSQAVQNNLHTLPSGFAGGASQGSLRWFVPGVSEDLRKAFAKETCNGCHQTEQTPVDVNFHISPYKHGVDRLSPFLNNPADPKSDDLARRTMELRNSLCR